MLEKNKYKEICKCPICGGNALKILKEEVVNFSRSKHQSVLNYNGSKIKIKICHYCSFGFATPLPNTNEFFKLKYDFNDFSPAYGKSSKKEIFRSIYKVIENYFTKKSKIIDLGSGQGEFVKYLDDKNFENVYALETNKTWAKDTRAILIENTIEDFLKNNSEKFTLITLIDVLEHLEKPKEILKLCFSNLNTKGGIFIKVPSLKAQYFKQTFKGFLNKEAEGLLEELDHINFFSFKNLVLVLEDIGFEVVYTSPSASELYEGNSFKCLASNLFRKFYFVVSKTIYRFFKVNTGFNIEVLAIKK